MKKIVIKKLVLQILLIFLLTFIPIQIFNSVLGPINIIWETAKSPISISKDIVLIEESNRFDLSKSRSIISTLNGYNVFEIDGYLQVLKLKEDKYILFNTVTLPEISHIYILNTNDFKVEEVTSKFSSPKISNLALGNNEYVNSNFCFYFKDISYKFDCYEYKDNDIKRIDMSLINNKLSKVKSNKYFADKTFEPNQKYMLTYILNSNEFTQDSLLSFRIIDGRINISEDNLTNHVFDNEDIPDYELPNSLITTVFPVASTRGPRVQSVGYVLKRYGFQDESEVDYNNELNPFISNPIIGTQFIEHKGVKYMSWLSSYDYNQINSGIIGNNTIYVKVNNSFYFINKPSKKIYKLNTKKDFDNSSPINVIYL